jgi:hypothetical protein
MGDGVVLGTPRDDDQVAGSQIDVAILHLDGDMALDEARHWASLAVVPPWFRDRYAVHAS